MNPIRDENGLCIECKPGEKGLLIGIIGKSIHTVYIGYANNQKATNSKILDDVFKKGNYSIKSEFYH